MKIALDAQLTVGSATGIGEYASGLMTALRRDRQDFVVLREPRLDPWRFDRRLLWDQVLLPARAGRCGATLLHCLSGTVPLLHSMPVVATVHDVAWLRVQGHAPWYARRYFGKFSLDRYRGCAAIVTDSAFSRDELLALLPGLDARRVYVVTPGVSEDFGRVPRQSDQRTILVVGTVERRKNLAYLVRMLTKLPQARVISIGPATPYREACAALARDLGVADRLVFRGYLERGELLALYGTAALAAVPSVYEGFGYAVAQALCAGLPCVSSDRASLSEFAGDGARVISLEDEAGWTDALAGALRGDEESHAAQIRESAISRFSWPAAARKIVEIYRLVDG